VRVHYPASAGYSGPLPLTVYSNTAVLDNATPSLGKWGTSVPLQIAAHNLRPSLAGFAGAGGRVTFGTNQLVPSVAGTNLQVSVDLSLFDAGPVSVAVVNPGPAAPSNPFTFTITPGLPTVATVSPASVNQATTTVVPVTISGTGFAKPDLAGNNGSQVHAYSAATNDIDLAARGIGAVNVVDPRTIVVTLSTTAALPGTYNISVWNPGGTVANPFQKSNSDKTFTINQ
jgi:hypothetical protein